MTWLVLKGTFMIGAMAALIAAAILRFCSNLANPWCLKNRSECSALTRLLTGMLDQMKKSDARLAPLDV